MVYLSLALLAVRSFARQPVPAAVSAGPTISVLKPVKGRDPDLYGSFASHCRQEYGGRFELLLGAAAGPEETAGAEEAARPEETAEFAALEAMAVRLRAEFPAVPVRVIACPERRGTNGKVSTLAQMVPHALGAVLVVNDADIRVGSGYLQGIAAWLGDPAVGLVTMPYRGQVVAGGGLWARLEALGISTDFFPAVLTSRMLEGGVHFGMGSTLALRRETLEAIGGLVPLVEHLADDYELGARVHAAGRRVVLSPEVVATTVPRYSLRGFMEHQMRWARTVRDARRWGYVGMVATFALPWAMATVLSSGFALWSFTLLSMALMLRVAVALSAGVGVLRDGQVLRDLFLLPLRDCVGLLFWAWSFAGDEVTWRGERFRIRRGVLVRV